MGSFESKSATKTKKQQKKSPIRTNIPANQ